MPESAGNSVDVSRQVLGVRARHWTRNDASVVPQDVQFRSVTPRLHRVLPPRESTSCRNHSINKRTVFLFHVCIRPQDFICRSALYNDETTDCKLASEDRRTRPANYVRNNNHKINYLENQCIRSHSTCPYEETNNAYPTYTDVVEREGVTSKVRAARYLVTFMTSDRSGIAGYM